MNCTTCKQPKLDDPYKQCVECRTQQARYMCEWRKHNREKVLTRSKDYHFRNRDKNLLRMKKWRENNPVKKFEMDRAYKAAHREQMRANSKRWIQEHPDEYRAIQRRCQTIRRARKLLLTKHFTQQEWLDLLEKYGHRCLCCNAADKTLEVDHVVPLKIGGTNTIDNIQPLCRSCNARKHAKHIDYRS